MINLAYDLNIYLSEEDPQAKLKIAYDILKNAYSNLPDEVGLNGSEVIAIMDDVYSEISK